MRGASAKKDKCSDVCQSFQLICIFIQATLPEVTQTNQFHQPKQGCIPRNLQGHSTCRFPLVFLLIAAKQLLALVRYLVCRHEGHIKIPIKLCGKTSYNLICHKY